MKLQTIFVDLDGVLVDIAPAALRVHGREDRLSTWPKGVYLMADVLGMSQADFWRPIDALGFDFWASLPPFEWWSDLVDAAHAAAGEVVLLSRPSEHPASAAGKRAWITHWFGAGFENYILTPVKHHLAGRGKLLIDDCEDNIRPWRNKGGPALLFPQQWNSGTGTVDDVIHELERMAHAEIE